MNDGGLSADKPPANEASTSYTYPDWEWVNGVAIIGPDGRVDPVRRVLTFTSAPLETDLDETLNLRNVAHFLVDDHSLNPLPAGRFEAGRRHRSLL